MYLQITTKCNMRCAHCCYSCNSHGKHMDYHTALDAIRFAESYGEEAISIGGGEPTLHPRFFDILKRSLDEFAYVWMATNGSRTRIMQRLVDIIDGNDFPDDDDYGDKAIYQEGKFSVALSTDHYHAQIDPWVSRTWRRRAEQRSSGFELRDITQSRVGVVRAGRAIRTQVWNSKESADTCVCSTIVIKPNGDLRLCGCRNSPVIGDVWNGIEDKWEDIIRNHDEYNSTNCYHSL